MVVDNENGDELYVFGYGGNNTFPATLRTPTQEPTHLSVNSLSTPTRVLHAHRIEVAWASWCDLILRINGSYHYTGTSLDPAQATAITALSTSSPAETPVFFGRIDTDGVLGFVNSRHRSLTLFHTPEEIAAGAPALETTDFAELSGDVRGIYFTAGSAAFVYLANRDGEPGSMIEFASLRHLVDDLTGDDSFQHERPRPRSSFPPLQSTSNIAALTVLSPVGTLHTLASDRRFARVAGRELDAKDFDTALPVPFLEHTVITRVASGGLCTAAVAEDGEMFIWGQSVAGTPGTLRCLAQEVGEEEDEFVRTVVVGEGLKVEDVAVGNAHVLVAVEGKGVWAAGHNREGALGLGTEKKGVEFMEEFAEVEGLRGKTIKQVVCAGMSSYVVVESHDRDWSDG